jgi:hypothetical protein
MVVSWKASDWKRSVTFWAGWDTEAPVDSPPGALLCAPDAPADDDPPDDDMPDEDTPDDAADDAADDDAAGALLDPPPAEVLGGVLLDPPPPAVAHPASTKAAAASAAANTDERLVMCVSPFLRWLPIMRNWLIP